MELQRPSGAEGKSRPSASPPFLRLLSPTCTSSRHVPGTRKGRSHFLARSSFPASIPRAPRRDTWSQGVRAGGFPGAPGRRLQRPPLATHLLAGAGLALRRSPEEGGPGGEEEVLGVLLQAAVAAAHAAGPVAPGRPPRGAGGQGGGAAPASPARFPARGPGPSCCSCGRRSIRRPGPSRRLPARLQARLGPGAPWTPPPWAPPRTGDRPSPTPRGPDPPRPPAGGGSPARPAPSRSAGFSRQRRGTRKAGR